MIVRDLEQVAARRAAIERLGQRMLAVATGDAAEPGAIGHVAIDRAATAATSVKSTRCTRRRRLAQGVSARRPRAGAYSFVPRPAPFVRAHTRTRRHVTDCGHRRSGFLALLRGGFRAGRLMVRTLALRRGRDAMAQTPVQRSRPSGSATGSASAWPPPTRPATPSSSSALSTELAAQEVGHSRARRPAGQLPPCRTTSGSAASIG